MTEIDTGIDASRVVSDQALFYHIATHLFKQGQPSLGASGYCKYRGAEGRACAIGCRIPDNEYSEDLEFHGVANSEIRRAAAIPDAQIELARALQIVHDWPENWNTTERMKARLRTVASEFKLSQRILDTLAFSDR